ncbi:hypothetical protein [Sphingopyxis sp. MWB1]|uniref:hypothetical protein n=1 Tax=Sphingopyxis sp. MWB1 TaxID=1537715 RepID=UPI00051A0CD1|nr:hypothetical protein [Sphingopyxis sp. MWB1]
MTKYTLLPLFLLALGGCSAIRPATMQMPSDLAQTASATPITGIGGGRHGRFAVGDYHGGFERSEERLAFFDMFGANTGHVDFSIEGPEISDVIDTSCRMREREIDLGIMEFKPARMALRCEFLADGRPFPARLELQEVSKGLGGALGRRERRGEIALGGEVVRMRSVHRVEGSPLAVAAPIGYIFEQRGRPVGAVELNGQARLFLAPGTDPGLARTVTIAAAALAIFWDPANSALDPD